MTYLISGETPGEVVIKVIKNENGVQEVKEYRYDPTKHRIIIDNGDIKFEIKQ